MTENSVLFADLKTASLDTPLLELPPTTSKDLITGYRLSLRSTAQSEISQRTYFMQGQLTRGSTDHQLWLKIRDQQKFLQARREQLIEEVNADKSQGVDLTSKEHLVKRILAISTGSLYCYSLDTEVNLLRSKKLREKMAPRTAYSAGYLSGEAFFYHRGYKINNLASPETESPANNCLQYLTDIVLAASGKRSIDIASENPNLKPVFLDSITTYTDQLIYGTLALIKLSTLDIKDPDSEDPMNLDIARHARTLISNSDNKLYKIATAMVNPNDPNFPEIKATVLDYLAEDPTYSNGIFTACGLSPHTGFRPIDDFGFQNLSDATSLYLRASFPDPDTEENRPYFETLKREIIDFIDQDPNSPMHRPEIVDQLWDHQPRPQIEVKVEQSFDNIINTLVKIADQASQDLTYNVNPNRVEWSGIRQPDSVSVRFHPEVKGLMQLTLDMPITEDGHQISKEIVIRTNSTQHFLTNSSSIYWNILTSFKENTDLLNRLTVAICSIVSQVDQQIQRKTNNPKLESQPTLETCSITKIDPEIESEPIKSGVGFLKPPARPGSPWTIETIEDEDQLKKQLKNDAQKSFKDRTKRAAFPHCIDYLRETPFHRASNRGRTIEPLGIQMSVGQKRINLYALRPFDIPGVDSLTQKQANNFRIVFGYFDNEDQRIIAIRELFDDHSEYVKALNER